VDEWYPKKIHVGAEGTPATINFMTQIFSAEQHFCYAEFGIWHADTAKNICNLFPNASLHLFDFNENIAHAITKLDAVDNKIFYYGNTQKYNDSYNWSLLQLLKNQNNQPLFDYCFLDGAHTFAVDALNFFLCDKLTRVGGYIDFDDYDWMLRGSSLDPSKIPEILDQYTEEQIDSKQVAHIVDYLVRPDPRYKEIVKNKIFQKIQ
jgi:hypothetical protein